MKNLVNKPEIRLEANKLQDKWDWEKHCGACDHFGIQEECPFYDLVDYEAYYEDICCNNFLD